MFIQKNGFYSALLLTIYLLATAAYAEKASSTTSASLNAQTDLSFQALDATTRKKIKGLWGVLSLENQMRLLKVLTDKPIKSATSGQNLTERLNTFILPILEKIPNNPRHAQKILEKTPTAVAKAWLGFMYTAGYIRTQNPTEKVYDVYQKLRPFFTQKDDDSLLKSSFESALKDLRSPSRSREERLEMAASFLRFSYDLERGSTSPSYPCFIDTHFPNTALTLASYWGSSRDLAHPVSTCQGPGLFKKLPSYPRFISLLKRCDKLSQPDNSMVGTMTFSLSAVCHKQLEFLEKNPRQSVEESDLKKGEEILAHYAENQHISETLTDRLAAEEGRFTKELTNALMQKHHLTRWAARKQARHIALKIVVCTSWHHLIDSPDLLPRN